MVTYCSAVGCNNKYHKDKKLSFHGFPKDPSMLKKWLAAIRRESFMPGTGAKLCSEHFRPDDFLITFGMRSLKCDAVPSIFKFPTHLMKKPVKLRSRRLINVVDEPGSSFPSTNCIALNTSQGVMPIREVQCIADIAQETSLENDNVSTKTTLSETKTLPVTNTLPVRRKRSVPAYVGDMEPSDLENPQKMKLLWEIATKTITRQKQTIKYLRNKIQRSDKKIKNLYDMVTHLKNCNKISQECFSIIEMELPFAAGSP